MKPAENYIKIIEGIIGRKLNEKSRSREDVAGRMCVAIQLMRDGFSTPEVGKMIKRDHATVLHYKKCMEKCKAFPRSFRYECYILDEFEKQLNN